MIASAVFRKFVLILCAIALIVSFIPYSYAAVTQINSPLYQPEPSQVSSNNIVTYTEYYVVQRSDHTWLYEAKFDLPAGDSPKIRLDNAQFVVICTIYEPANIVVNIYDVITGDYLSTNIMQPDTSSYLLLSGYNYCVRFALGYFPKVYRDDPDMLGAYPIVDIDESSSIELTDTTPFVTWSQVPVNQVYIRSVLPEPVFDRYNRYLVLTGASESHLLWIQIHFAEVQFLISSTANTYDHYDLSQCGAYALTFRNTNTGFGLRLEMDPAFFLYLSNLGYDGAVSCHIYISDFNLITGEFVSMQSASLFDMQPNVYYNVIDDDMQIDAVGISCYGVNYNDISTDNHLHRAAVIYSVDPSFDVWRNDVITWMQRIYEVLDQTVAAEDVTIDQDTQAASELHKVIDNLQPTDENGSKVNTADVVSERFSDAQQYVSDLSVGAVEFNSVVDDFLFSNPFFYVPLIVALAAGLIITILGKNKSND